MMRRQARAKMTLVTTQPSLRSLQRSLEKKMRQLQRSATTASGCKLLTNKSVSLKRFPLRTMQGTHCIRTQRKVLVLRLCTAYASPDVHLVRYENAAAVMQVPLTVA